MVHTRVYSPNRLPSDIFYTEHGWYVVDQYGKSLRAADQPPAPENRWQHYKRPDELVMRQKFKVYGGPKKDKSEAVKAREKVARKKAISIFFDAGARKREALKKRDTEARKRTKKHAVKAAQYDHPPGAFYTQMHYARECCRFLKV